VQEAIANIRVDEIRPKLKVIDVINLGINTPFGGDRRRLR